MVNSVSTALTSVGQDRLEAVVVVKALKEQIPKSDQGIKEAVVEPFGLESRQLEQRSVGQELDKEQQELSRSEGVRRPSGFFGILCVCIL